MSQPTDFDDELELTDYVRILRRRWVWVLIPFLGLLAVSGLLTANQAPRYCATAQVFIAPSEAQRGLQGDSNVLIANRDLANEINIAFSDAVRGEVVSILGVDPDVTVTGDNESDILWFEGCGPDAESAPLYANTWAQVYVSTKQGEAAASIEAAVSGFQDRLQTLRENRRTTREPLDDLEDRLARAGDAASATLRADVDRLRADLAVELGLIDAQIQTIASAITQLELNSELARTGTAQVIQVAAPPTSAANAPLSRNLVLGGIVGLILGAAIALLAENLDRSIKTSDDITGIPVLGSIPKPGRELVDSELALAAMNHTGSTVAEAYQKVRTSVEFALLGRHITSLLITSPSESAGKTTTSSNLAWAMSAVDHRVVLVDVDFRKPRIHEVFQCPPEPGLSDNLLHGTALSRLALRVDDDRSNMVVIPTGAQPPSPGDFVASPAFSNLLRNLEAEADLVILDAPPVLPVSDALSIARQVDAVIVVAKAGKTTGRELTKTVDSLRAVGADVLGVCLVGVREDQSSYGYGYGYGYGSKRRSGRDQRRAQAAAPTPSASAESATAAAQLAASPPSGTGAGATVLGPGEAPATAFDQAPAQPLAPTGSGPHPDWVPAAPSPTDGAMAVAETTDGNGQGAGDGNDILET
jgi:capsular exopolysaccharide synthesis family protein